MNKIYQGMGILLTSLLLSLGLYAADCTKKEAMEAESNASTIKNWEDLYKSYKKFSHCDDGSIAEGYSESVSKILSENWKQLDKLKIITKTDHKFENFVFKHIDETMSKEAFIKIQNNLQKDCPKLSSDLCKKMLINFKAQKN